MAFRRKYNGANHDRARDLTRVREFGPSQTQQGPTIDCDINVLVKRFGIDKGAPIPPVPVDPRDYSEFDDQLDLATALTRVRDADAHFMRLPASLRARFENDPVQLWNFVSDPRNAEEACAIGLLQRRSPTTPQTAGEAPSGNPPPPTEPQRAP